MAFQYDIDKIFAELEQKAKEKQKQQEEKENNPIDSPDDAPQTQVVAPATSKTTEDTHGGDEASKEIKDSPNSVNDGKQKDKDNKSKKTENSGEQGQGDGQGDKEKNKPNTTPEDLQKIVEKAFEEKQKKFKEFKNQHKQEYLKKYILEIIKKISAQHAVIDKQDGSETFDKKQMLQHMIKKQNYKLLGDKYDLRDARYVQFFIDTSGVYGCGSNKIMHELMPQVIYMLEKQGYECYIAACGNGFYQRDMVEDEYYGTRKTLEGYKTGKVSKIACPTPQTAAKMANEAEFSIILADFDGLSSICKMANLCQKDKIPYFLCTEDRYPWEDPTFHDWVDPEFCNYDAKFVYDVSMDGNPTLEEYNYRQYDDYYDDDYEQDDDYEEDDEYEQDDDYEEDDEYEQDDDYEEDDDYEQDDDYNQDDGRL